MTDLTTSVARLHYNGLREFVVSIEVVAYEPERKSELIMLSLRAWAPVFEKLEPAVQPYVYRAFYPNGWHVRQAADISSFLEAEGDMVWMALEAGSVLGWVGVRLHAEDKMGEIYIIAVDPEQQRRGIASRLIEHAISAMREAGMAIAMIETGDDPGHAPSRATYERSGFKRWPVARYFREI